MKIPFISLILLIGISSCKKTDSRLEGSWIYAYNIDSLGRQNTSPTSLSIIQFDGDKMKEQVLNNPSYGGILNNTYPLKITSEKVTIGKEVSISFKDILGDSLILKNEDENIKNNVIFIYKRLPNTTPKAKAKANLAFKLFKFKGNDSEVAFVDFINDSILIEYDSQLKKCIVNQWYIQNTNNNLFLINDYRIDPVALVIDSIENNRIHLTSFHSKITHYQFDQIEKPLAPELLYGKWQLTNKIYSDSTNSLEMKPFWTPVKKLFFCKDSIKIYEKNSIENLAWTISGSGNIIVIKPNPLNEENIWKIISINEKELVLQWTREKYFKSNYVFERIKTTGNNSYK